MTKSTGMCGPAAVFRDLAVGEWCTWACCSSLRGSLWTGFETQKLETLGVFQDDPQDRVC